MENNMEKKIIITTSGDASGTINDLIDLLQGAIAKGATHYKMRWSNDPMWAFKFFELYKELSENEIKQLEIERLEKELAELKK